MSLGLGIDAGGTATRWALADADGRPRNTGLAAPLSGHIFSCAAGGLAPHAPVIAAEVDPALTAARLAASLP